MPTGRLVEAARWVQDPLYRPDPVASLVSYLTAPFRPTTRYYVLQGSDLGPLIADLSGVAIKVLRAIARR